MKKICDNCIFFLKFYTKGSFYFLSCEKGRCRKHSEIKGMEDYCSCFVEREETIANRDSYICLDEVMDK